MLSAKLFSTINTGSLQLIGFTFVASQTTNIGSSTITIPSSAQAGDVGILLDGTVNTTATLPTNVVPSGFTEIMTTAFVRANGTSSARMTCSYKVLQSGDPNSSITGLGNTNPRKTFFVFRPDSSISSVSFSGVVSQTESPDAGTTETLSLVMDSRSKAIGVAYITAGNIITNIASSPTSFDAQVAPSDQFQRSGYKVFTSTASDQTVTATKTNSTGTSTFNMFTCFYLTAS
jgi:hypothetical protein